MTGIELAKLGKCEACGEDVPHGPWTDEEISQMVADTGEQDFGDWCDDCMVRMCFGGDQPYAEKMLGRALVLKPRKSIGLFSLLGVGEK